MGIDFGSLGVGTAPAPAGATLNLSKGMTLDLTKRNPGLQKVMLGAGWDVAQAGKDFDLDISAFLLVNGKVRTTADVIFFNNKTAPGVMLSGDNRTGAGDGDDETIFIDLAAVDPAITEIAFCVTIYDAVTRGQTFGMVKNSYVRLVNDATGAELCRFPLNTDFSTDTAMIFAKLKKSGADWNFEATGEGKQADLQGLLNIFA